MNGGSGMVPASVDGRQFIVGSMADHWIKVL